MSTPSSCQLEIDRFLSTGDYDVLHSAWPGGHALDRIKRGSDDLEQALLAELRRREARVTVPRNTPIRDGDIVAFSREKLEPMVNWFFRRDERGAVLALLEKSVVFLSPENIEALIRKGSLDTAWEIANIYLRSIGARPISENARGVVGLSVESTCYVSLEYFTEKDPFADFVVHEAAHVFHNTKRRTIGLKETRRKQWLLPIEFRKRETFAYVCEAYSRIRNLSQGPKERQALLEKLNDCPPPPNEYVDHAEYLEIVSDAVRRRNGWKAILEACSPSPTKD